MIRSLSFAGALAGAMAIASLACSDSADPPAAPSAVESAARATPKLTPQQSGTTQRLQAISAVNRHVAWASGTGGTYTVTTDGGATWRAGVVPGAKTLEFRDVEGVSARVAYLMAAGPGRASRIYKTQDGGATWQLQFKNTLASAFYDCFAFWDDRRGVTFSDAITGVFPAIRTTNGKDWVNIGGRLPRAQAGEAAFAASGTCIATQGDRRAWIVTGGAAKARVLATTNAGDSWRSYDTPIVQGTPAAGGFSIAFRDATHGILAGGDLEDAGVPTKNVAVSEDGGATWSLASPTPFVGAAFGLAYVPNFGDRAVVATGPGGAAYSTDEGGSWTGLSGVTGYWAADFADQDAGWLVGVEGRILKVGF